MPAPIGHAGGGEELPHEVGALLRVVLVDRVHVARERLHGLLEAGLVDVRARAAPPASAPPCAPSRWRRRRPAGRGRPGRSGGRRGSSRCSPRARGSSARGGSGGSRTRRWAWGLPRGTTHHSRATAGPRLSRPPAARPWLPYDARMKRVVVGISGSTGAIYGIRLLEVLKASRRRRDPPGHQPGTGKRTLVEETDLDGARCRGPGRRARTTTGTSAPRSPAARSRPPAMVIAPCSMKMVSALANSFASTLIARAGDVTLKEGRTLVAVVRETPLHVGHLPPDARARGDRRRDPPAHARVLPATEDDR